MTQDTHPQQAPQSADGIEAAFRDRLGAPAKFEASKYLTKLKGKDYLEVKWRLLWLRTEHPDAQIRTTLVEHDPGVRAVCSADVQLPATGARATGWAQEERKDFGEYLEKCETKALGRALAALGYGTQFCDDMAYSDASAGDGQRVVDSPVQHPQPHYPGTNGAALAAAGAGTSDRVAAARLAAGLDPVTGLPATAQKLVAPAQAPARPTAPPAAKSGAQATQATPTPKPAAKPQQPLTGNRFAVVDTGTRMGTAAVLEVDGIRAVARNDGEGGVYYATVDTCPEHQDAAGKAKRWSARAQANGTLSRWRHASPECFMDGMA